MKIYVMGTGGLGGLYGALASRAGHDVTFVARGNHLPAIRDNGLRVRMPNEEIIIQPAKTASNPAEVGPVDLILFCVKAYDAEAAAQQIKPLVGDDTVVIPVLNGIDHIDTLIRNVGAEHVLGGVAVVSAHREAPGIIATHRQPTDTLLRFGELGGRGEPRCRAIQADLALEGVEAIPDIVHALWSKFASVCGAGLCSVVRGNFGVVAGYEETLKLVEKCVNEVIATANARQITLEADLARGTTETMKRAPHVKPSMLVDLERGDRLEVEWLNGSISRMGKALNVPTPVNDFVYACLKPWALGRVEYSV